MSINLTASDAWRHRASTLDVSERLPERRTSEDGPLRGEKWLAINALALTVCPGPSRGSGNNCRGVKEASIGRAAK